jgi:hypothetical protein
MKVISEAINEIYEAEALHHPMFDNINHLFNEGKEAGFPGSCIASIDCMHWEWKNVLPLGRSSCFKVRLVCSLLCWRLLPITVADSSTSTLVLLELLTISTSWSLPLCWIMMRFSSWRGTIGQFIVSGTRYTQCLLARGWDLPKGCMHAALSKHFPMQKLFASAHEAKRKDIECAFGMLQSRLCDERHH